ncbi:MAG: hypothetical protein KGK10_05375 [Rhodospirillales bacterium]|nr:hypothetical protein [Rhodospirillales bacterium]
MRQQIAASAGAKDAFTLIYRTNYWGNDESASGNGSSLASTETLRLELAGLLQRLAIRSMLDAPCGDFNWMRTVPFPEGFHYIGGDIVDDLVAGCRARHGAADREFIVLDLTRDAHPPTDLWFCRDGLIHLSNADILGALTRFVESGARYCLLTHYHAVEENTDITTGLTRHTNLMLPPFGLPPPREQLPDRPVGEAARELGLWTRADIAQALGL